jgi:hypothetical protein
MKIFIAADLSPLTVHPYMSGLLHFGRETNVITDGATQVLVDLTMAISLKPEETSVLTPVQMVFIQILRFPYE